MDRSDKNQWYNPYVQSPGGIWVPGVPIVREMPTAPPPKVSRQVRRQAERRAGKRKVK